MPHRFYAPEASTSGRLVSLPPAEASHLARVLRIGVGETVRVFDGQGNEFQALVATVDRVGVTLRLSNPVEPPPEPRVHLTLAQAVLKGRKFELVVRDATMLGAAVIQPIFTTRTERHAPATRLVQRAVKRWHTISIASAKQCGRAVIPSIKDPVTLDSLVAETTSKRRIILVEPRSCAKPDNLQTLAGQPVPVSATIAIGPEGGWSDSEVALAVTGGFELLTLGVRTMRADAVPVAALAVLGFVWGDL